MVEHPRGFTLIELLIVLAIMATLVSIVAPRYFASVGKAEEAVLRTDLRLIREAIDKYRADQGAYPKDLETLVAQKYISHVPTDPITVRADTWIAVTHPDGITQGVYDLRSGAPGKGIDGTPYLQW